MSRFRRHARTLALLCGSAGCSTSSAPAVDVLVRVSTDSIAVTRVSAGAVTWLHFTVPLSIENLGATAIDPYYCASTLEVLRNGQWQRAWAPICTLSAASDRVPSGTTRAWSLTVAAAESGPGAPRWEGSAGASYRVMLGLIPSRRDGLIPLVPSNTFSLRDAP